MMIGEGVAATGDKVGELWSAAVLLISLISYPRLCGKHFDLRTQTDHFPERSCGICGISCFLRSCSVLVQ